MKLKLHAALFALCLLLTNSPAKADDFHPLGPVHLGVVGGIGLPSPISGQVVFKYKKLIGANLELGMLPEINVPVGPSVRVHQEMIDFSARLYPFSGAFFLACGVGAQRISATATASKTEQGVNVTGDASVIANTIFVSPRLGFLHKFDFGLAIGMDVGVELPIDGSVETRGAANIPASRGGTVNLPIPKEATDIADKVKSLPIPIVHLLQLGYIF